MISKPELPAKAGYVEVIDESGNHVYKQTNESVATDDIMRLINDLQNESINTNKVIDTMIGALNNDEEAAE